MGSNQKARILKLLEILQEQTDTEHLLTSTQLIQKLDDEGYSITKKSLLDDISTLIDYGVDIQTTPSCHGGIQVLSRDFELAELKLLVDAVQSSKFISEKKSNIIISKLCKLVSKYEASALKRQVYVSGRVKNENNAILYSIDTIHQAIQDDANISFQYADWTLKKKLEPRHEGQRYHVSPYLLTWDDGYYYLIGLDVKENIVKHFRTDKMLNVQEESSSRVGQNGKVPSDFAKYAKETFGMFGGEEELVTFQVDNSAIGSIIDRFGEDITIIENKDTFQFSTRVRLSPVFYAWVIQFKGKIQITAPKKAVDEIQSMCQSFLERGFNHV